MTQELQSRGARSTLHMRRELAHPPHKVWAALIEPERIAEWFPTTVKAELRVGGAVEFGFGDTGTVTDLDPGRLIAYTWGTDHLRWEVVPDGAGSVLLLEHSFDDRAGAASFASGWHTCISELMLALAGRPGADTGVDHVALHEQYVTELGLDTAETERTSDGWRVRFERQLTRPADAVWPDLLAACPAADVLVSEPPKLLEQRVRDGRLRMELGEGTGHGARLTMTWAGTDEAAKDAIAVELPERARAVAR
jgi:uncharacterized protein YndB with AHSA1/START domain